MNKIIYWIDKGAGGVPCKEWALHKLMEFIEVRTDNVPPCTRYKDDVLLIKPMSEDIDSTIKHELGFLPEYGVGFYYADFEGYYKSNDSNPDTPFISVIHFKGEEITDMPFLVPYGKDINAFVRDKLGYIPAYMNGR